MQTFPAAGGLVGVKAELGLSAIGAEPLLQVQRSLQFSGFRTRLPSTRASGRRAPFPSIGAAPSRLGSTRCVFTQRKKGLGRCKGLEHLRGSQERAGRPRSGLWLPPWFIRQAPPQAASPGALPSPLPGRGRDERSRLARNPGAHHGADLRRSAPGPGPGPAAPPLHQPLPRGLRPHCWPPWERAAHNRSSLVLSAPRSLVFRLTRSLRAWRRRG